MSKRILAMLLTLAMVLSCLPAVVAAEEASAQHTCEHCDQTPEWVSWDGTGDLEAGKHYVLTAEVLTLSESIKLSEGTYVLCLNGNTISGATAKRIFDLSGTARLIITDHTATGEGSAYTAGKLTGATNSAVAVSGNASFTMYDGIMENNKRPTGGTGSDGGAIRCEGQGAVNIYGGLFRNNEARYGAVVYASGTGTEPVQVHLENALLTGNTTSHTGAIHCQNTTNLVVKNTQISGNTTTGTLDGGIYIQSAATTVTVSGKVIIDDNTNRMQEATIINRNMLLNNAANKLKVDGLAQGSRIQLAAKSEDPAQVIVPTNQTSWDCGWITLGTESVSWNDANNDGKVEASEFTAGHYHKGIKYTAVTGNTALPTTAGNYYLTQDVNLTKLAVLDKNVTLCLNGHQVYAAANSRILQLTKDSGAVVTIEDCTAYTDAEGVYHAGGLTGASITSSGPVYINAGTTLKLYGGKISGNTANAGAGIYAAGKVYMYGGEISGNKATQGTSNRHGGAIMCYGATAGFYMEGGTITGNTATQYGGGVFVTGGATAEFKGGTITGNTASHGGGVGLYTATFAVGNVTISGNTATTEGGGLWGANKANITLTDTTISGNTAPNGAGVVAYTAQIKLVGGKISGNTATGSGGGVFVTGANGHFTLAGGEISRNTAKFGGGVLTQSNGKLTVTGGDITKNASTAQGGGAYISTGTNFYMEGGTISGNTAQRLGGGVYNLKSVSHISGGTIENNISEEGGGGIALAGDTSSALNLSGGTITGNTAPVSGGIYTLESSVLNISGNPKVIGNSAGNKASNLCLEGDTLLMNVGTMTEGAKVSVSGVPYRAISAPVATDCSASFASDSAMYAVKYQSGALYLDVAVEHNHCVCGGASANGCDHTKLKFAPWESTTTLPPAGAYYLMDDVTLTNVAAISEDLTLCLNGHSITGAEGKRILQLTRDTGVTVSIVDCTAHTDDKGVYQAGAITGANIVSSGPVYLNAGTTLKLYSGKISGNTANAGAGVYGAGTFYMYGGEISGNKATASTANRHGGGVMINGEGAAFHMYGGTICNNEATQYGGGVFVTGGAKATFTGGTVTGNKAAQGGGVGLYKQTFEVGEVTISGNTATTEGGGLWVASGAEATLNGTTISGNSAVNGAGVAVRDAQLKLADCKITGNATTAEGTGGGIFATGESGKILMQGGTVSENTAKAGAGVITIAKSAFTMEGGTITGNKAGTAGGGGVYVSSNTNFTLLGGTIEKNETTGYGGGVYMLISTAEMTGGTIRNNTAGKEGGGIGTRGGAMKLSGVTVSGNKAGTNGGGIALMVASQKNADGTSTSVPATAELGSGAAITGNQASSTGTGGGVFVSGEGSGLLVNGGTISKNTAKYGGGVITQTKSSLTLKSGKITENKSTSNGGGVYVSTNTTLNMEGGEISKNSSQLNGGGVYFLSSNLNMTGGKISGNTAKTDGGGMYMYITNSVFKGGSVTGNSAKNAGGIRMTGGKHSISGLTVSYNTAEGDGGGIQIGRQMVKENGVTVDKLPDFTMYSGTFVGNKAKNGAGMLLLSDKAVYTIYNAYIAENEAANGGGGIYVSTGTTLNMYGGTITKNYGKTGGGIMMLLSTGNYENVEISDNTGNNAPALMINQPGEHGDIRVKNMKVLNNVGTASGAVVVQGEAVLYMEDSQFKGNSTEKTGGAIFTTTRAESYLKNTTFEDNSAGADAGAVMLGLNSITEMDGCTFNGNEAGNNGGAIYNRGLMYLSNSKVLNNTCVNNGAGIGSGKTGSTHTGDKCGLYIENVISSGNQAGNNGGGLFGSLGCHVVATDLTLTDNEAKGNGGGAWVQEDFMVKNLVATGNTAAIGAVYLAASHHDGQSYFAGVMKFSGKVVIQDNQGGGLFVGERTTLTLEGDSLEAGSYMDVTLYSGLLTQKVFGVYDYEGSNLEYVITPGDRSVTDPEHLKQAGAEGSDADEAAAADIILYVGIGVFVLAIAAIAVLLAMKKKKADSTAKEASKE